MKRLLCLGAPLSLALSGGLTALVNQLHPGPVYSVAAVRAHLVHDAAAWVGRPVLVRGILSGCLHLVCPGREPYWPPSLMDANQPWAVDPLPVAGEGPDTLRAFVRRVPVFGRLVPPPQVVHWERAAIYRVRLSAAPAWSCPAHRCYKAVVLDAAPGALGEG
jgi:hypothetical protein